MDAASFKQQFLPCHAKLYRVAFRLMGNVQDAEDMVQEAYLKLWKKRDELPEVASIEAYCVTLIKICATIPSVPADRTKTADCPKS